MIQEIAITCIIKTLREDAACVETKMHLRVREDVLACTQRRTCVYAQTYKGAVLNDVFRTAPLI